MVLLRMLAFRPVAGSQGDETGHRDAGRQQSAPAGGEAAHSAAERAIPRARQAAPVTSPTEAVSESRVAYADKSLDWLGIVKATGVGGMARELAHNCVLRGVDEKSCVLLLDPAQQQVRSPRVEERLQSALQAYYQRPLKLVIKVEKAAEDTPAVALERQRQEKQQAAEREIERDETVQAMMEAFNARVVPGSIEPLDE